MYKTLNSTKTWDSNFFGRKPQAFAVKVSPPVYINYVSVKVGNPSHLNILPQGVVELGAKWRWLKKEKLDCITLNISEELHKELKVMAAFKETNMTELVLKLVKEELKKFKKTEN